jgi:hypothetical protein
VRHFEPISTLRSVVDVVRPTELSGCHVPTRSRCDHCEARRRATGTHCRSWLRHRSAHAPANRTIPWRSGSRPRLLSRHARCGCATSSDPCGCRASRRPPSPLATGVGRCRCVYRIVPLVRRPGPRRGGVVCIAETRRTTVDRLDRIVHRRRRHGGPPIVVSSVPTSSSTHTPTTRPAAQRQWI